MLLSSQFVLLAPDLILVELANVIWKKSGRSEISKSKPYIETLEQLSDVFVLRPVSELVTRAAALAVQLNHPLNDCLYRTCALEYEVPLVTADELHVQTATNDIPNIDVWSIGHSEFVHRLS